ncbi:MAG: apolipoprotein N-acyltransferase [Alphaproteobacteria bacterium]|jgi:apolipoprotein N-acyltransferase|nr:apolipoprotein N-acyltransferase [Alphaproteobacteria bacterium]
MTTRNKFKYIFTCIFSFFYVLGFAPFNFFFLGVIAIIGLSFIFKSAKNRKQLIHFSLLSALVISTFGAYWLTYAANYTFGSMFLGVLVLIGFAFLYSVFMFMVSVPIYLANKNKKSFYVVLVLSWTAMDAFKFYFLGGFPWFLSAYLWGQVLPIIQIVSVIGLIGLSLMTYALIFSFFILFNGSYARAFRFNVFAILVIIFAGLYIYGSERIDSLNAMPAEKTLNVRLVQTNISQTTKMNLNNSEIIATSVLPQISDGITESTQMIFLPETSFVYFDSEYFANKISKTPKNVALIVGVLRIDEQNRAFNSVFNIVNHQTIDYYDKIKLVPFGERMPLADYLPNFFSFVGLESLTPGDSVKILTVDNYILVPTVCFEGLFPLEDITANDVDFILNVANEAWFDQSIELDQNWDIYKYRSIETGVMALKVANTGISGVYDFTGNLLHEVEPFKKINADLILPVKKVKTIFSMINYHLINYIIFTLYGLMFLWVYIRKNSV